MTIEVVEATSLKELTYKQLKQAIDPGYLDAQRRIRELRKRGTRYAGLKGNSMMFRTFSSEYGKNGIIYEQEIKLLDLADKLKQADRPLRDRARDALVNGDVGLRCTCPAFVYWGFAYILYHMRAAAPGRTLWPTGGGSRRGRGGRTSCGGTRGRSWPAPVKTRPKYYGRNSHCNRNWRLQGVMCKHLGLIMEVLGAHWTSLVRDLKNQGYE